MPRAYFGLGANLQDPARQVQEAVRRIGAWPDVQLLARSSLYRSAPMGPGVQADYCNAACVVETRLSPERLLEAVQDLERDMGRQRSPERWAARLIDVDLLHYVGEHRNGPALTLPHPGIASRNFVLVPLSEIAPDLEIDGVGSVAAQAARMGRAGLSIWPDA